MATYYSKRKGITYRDYTGSGDALDQEAWYAAQDANYVSTANNALKNAKFTASYDVFNKFVTDYAKPAADYLSKIQFRKGSMFYPFYGSQTPITTKQASTINSIYNKIQSGQTVSDSEKENFYYVWNDTVNYSRKNYFFRNAVSDYWNSVGLGGNSAYAASINSKLQQGINSEYETWKNGQDFYNKVLTANVQYETLLAKEAAAEKKRQQTIQAETEAKTAARKDGHQVQTEVFKDAAELMYGSKVAEEETTGSGITPGVAASGLTLSGTNTTGGKLSGTTATTDNPVSRREKARRGLLGGVA